MGACSTVEEKSKPVPQQVTLAPRPASADFELGLEDWEKNHMPRWLVYADPVSLNDARFDNLEVVLSSRPGPFDTLQWATIDLLAAKDIRRPLKAREVTFVANQFQANALKIGNPNPVMLTGVALLIRATTPASKAE